MKIEDGGYFDVIVAGAGSAGFCAAVQAGRAGLSVALFEHFSMPGGTLTVLGSNSIDQFNNPHKPVGDRMIITGIGWEFCEALARRGFATIPDMDAPYKVHWQYGVKVNPIAAAQLMDDFLLEANIHLFYRQAVVTVETTETETETIVDSVIVTTKNGLVRHLAKIFIDCTGDGDICAWAGAKFHINETLQPGTMRLYPGCFNGNSEKLVQTDDIWRKLVSDTPSLKDFSTAGFQTILTQEGDNINHVCGLNSADSSSRTQTEIISRRDQIHMLQALKEGGNPFKILGSAPETAARESRRIIGDTIMTGQEYLEKYVYDDAVCYTYWFIDIHREGQPAEIIYLQDEKTPTIPLSAMRPIRLKNVLVAGRCVSADRASNSAIRVKASCMAMGQAAAAAAVVALQQGTNNVRKAHAEDVRKYLSDQGAIVPDKNNRR